MPRATLLTLAFLLFARPADAAPDEPPTESTPAEPTLAVMPVLQQLVPATLPPDTPFPAPEVVVVLEIDVSATGAVEAVRVQEAAGAPFDDAAVTAAGQFRFEPARLTTGEAVPVTITFRMRIQAPPPPPPPPVRYAGTLLERGTRRPLANVPVAARVGDEVVARGESDASGRFSLEVPAATFQLVALPAGHDRVEVAVTAQPGEQIEERFFVESTGAANETVVRAEPIRREVTKRVIPKDVVNTVPGTAGDTIKVVQNLPGVARAQFNAGLIVLRGASPGDSRVFLEGQEIPSVYHFGGIRSTFNSYFLEAVDFVPGNFSADFGRATGGVIDVQVREPASDTFRGNVDINVYDAGFAMEGPLPNGWSMGGAFHRSYIDTLLPLILPDDAPISFDTAPRYYDYQLLTNYRPNDDHHLRILFYGSLDRIRLLFDDPQDDPKIRGAIDARLMFHKLFASYDARVTPRLRQETSMQFGWNQISTEIGPEFFFDLDVIGFGLRHTWTWEALPWLDVRGGLDFDIKNVGIALTTPRPPKEGEQSVPISTSTALGVDKWALLVEPALFAELRFKPLSNLAILPSVRVDWYNVIDRWTVDPRLTVRYEVVPGTALNAGVGLYQQPPAPDEADPDTGTPGLLPSRSVQASLGIQQRIIDGLDVDLVGFYKHLDRIVIRNPASAFDPTADVYTNDGTGQIYGLEFLLKANIPGRFYGWIAYTFQRSLRTDGPGTSERPFDYDQPHILTVLGSYTIGWGWSVGLRFRLVSGNPETPVVGAVYDTRSDTYVPQYGKKNSGRLGLFHQLDLRVDKTFTFNLWKLSLYLDIQNLYNQGNAEGWSYNYDYTERTKLTGLPILPILGIKGEW